jgi:hypothetical protein
VVTGTVDGTVTGGWVVVVEDVGADVVELAGTSTEHPESTVARATKVRVHHFIRIASRMPVSCAESGAPPSQAARGRCSRNSAAGPLVSRS